MAAKRKGKGRTQQENLAKPSKWRLQHGGFSEPERAADPDTGTGVLPSFSAGFGSTAAGVGVLIVLGAMFAKLLADSGGADQIVGFERWDVLNLTGFGYSSVAQAQTHVVKTGADAVFLEGGADEELLAPARDHHGEQPFAVAPAETREVGQ